MSPEPSYFQAEQPQLFQPFFTGEVNQPSDLFCGSSLDLLQGIHMLRLPELDAVYQVRSHKRRVNRLVTLLFMQSRIQLAFWAAVTCCQLVSDFLSTNIPESAGLLSVHSLPCLCWCQRLPQPRCRNLLNSMRSTVAHSSSLPRPQWMASFPSSR